MNDRLRVDHEIKKTIWIREWMPESEDVAGKVQEVGSAGPGLLDSSGLTNEAKSAE